MLTRGCSIIGSPVQVLGARSVALVPQPQMVIARTLQSNPAQARIGDDIVVFAKVLHPQDPTQLLLKELSGKVTRADRKWGEGSCQLVC